MSTRIICDAIATRALLAFVYQGRRHLVEPHSLGYELRDEQTNGPLLLRAWCDGSWSDFQVKFMNRLQLADEMFVDARPGHRSMAVVLCDVYGKRRSAD
ncbi:hypothetical protein [Bradyrhizobium sp. HKCCYLR20261]|uniref:hypothetical protein n=1 Tax=Bradyrhizobium sp. HKCCYLR20261 TaxID=3420760 RepID=UPI003EB828A5